METIGRRACRRSDGGALATPVGYGRVQYGYISNVVSAEQGVGTAECPWYIQVRPGQRINFTILNFLGQSVSLFISYSLIAALQLIHTIPNVLLVVESP